MISAFDTRVVLTGSASSNEFIRLPREVISKVERLEGLALNTSGIRARFKTDSKSIRIVAKNGGISQYTHMPISSSSGFDIYINNKFEYNVRPAINSLSVDETYTIQDKHNMNLIDIYFPLYNSVDSFYFDIEKGALLERAEEPEKPLVFYGSSITQGGCASRPGNSYTNMLASLLERNIINLGFSGNAKGSLYVAEYIASLEMAAFIYDYDHNSPDTKWLIDTHEAFFKVIRSRKPYLPVIMMSRPGYERWGELSKANNAVVMTTYLNAYKSGDVNVYFIDGKTLFGVYGRDRCTVDGTHPNDIGFERMTEAILPELKRILEV